MLTAQAAVEQPPRKVRFVAAMPAELPVSEPMSKVPRVSKQDVRSIMATLAVLRAEKARQLATHVPVIVEAAEEAGEEGDVEMTVPQWPVVPQRTADRFSAFEPYRSTGQASPHTIWEKTTVQPVSLGPTEDPEGLRFSFFGNRP